MAVDVLLDTHAFSWAITDDPRLSQSARHALETDDLFLSVVSIWEIIIKVQIGKLKLPDVPSRYLPRHISALEAEVLPVRMAHVMRLESLPFHHRDPFDRLLVAQGLEERLPLLSDDALLAPYGIEICW